MKKLPKRYRDVRVEVTRTVFREYASRFWVRKGTVLDGWVDKEGNFRQAGLTIFPAYFRVLGRFQFHVEHPKG